MRIATLDNKYKERDPKETVKNITEMLKSVDPKLSVRIDKVDEQKGLYWHSVSLCYDDKFIVEAAGKGLTEEFSLASAYGELYERFTAENLLRHSTPDEYFTSDSRALSYEETGSTFIQFRNEHIKRAAYEMFMALHGKMAGVPFKSLVGEDDVYIDPEFKFHVYGSNGTATGNSVEEALNQGISEICERYVQQMVYHEECEMTKLSESALERLVPTLYEKIKILNEMGITVKCYDASYTTGLPVACSVIIDKRTMCYYVSFGSFPVFEIALERTLTEAYQGIDIDDPSFAVCQPFTGVTPEGEDRMSIDGIVVMPEDVFVNAKEVDDIDMNVYRDKTLSNEEILDWYVNLFKVRGYSAWYRETGYSDKIYSVIIHIPALENHMENDIANFNLENKALIDEILEKIHIGDISRLDAMRYLSTFEYIFQIGRCESRYLSLKIASTEYKKMPEPIFSCLFQIIKGDYFEAYQIIERTRMLCEIKGFNDIKIALDYILCGIDIEDAKRRIKLWDIDETIFDLILFDKKGFIKKYLTDVIYSQEVMEHEANIEHVLKLRAEMWEERNTKQETA